MRKSVVESEDAPALTAWEQRSLDRSLDDARRRALGKSRRFLEAAGQILFETGGVAFTVQDVVDRSRMSLGTFYRAFAGKDELLLAMFEESVTRGVERQRHLLSDVADPLEQLRTCVNWLATPRAHVADDDTLGLRAFTILHFTLASTRPADLAHALEPQRLVFLDSIDRGVANGQIRTDIPSRRLADIVLSLALLAAHSSILRAGGLNEVEAPEDLWKFSVEGLLNRAAEGSPS